MIKIALLSLCLFAALLIGPCQAAEGGIVEPHVSAMHSDLAPHLLASDIRERLPFALSIIRNRWNLPNNHLEEAALYDPRQFNFLNQHLQHPYARFWPVYQGLDYRLYASPVRVQRAGTYQWQHALALFTVKVDGSIRPMGFTGLSTRSVPGHGQSLYNLVAERATLTWGDLLLHHGRPLRLVQI